MPTMKLNGTEIYYEDHGPRSASSIVFSPPLFMNTSIFQPMIEAFSDEYRVIVYDHRNQGRSERTSKRPDLQTTTQDVIDLIERLEAEPCHFVGNCLGAYVGLHLAIRRSDLLQSCTLMGAVADDETQQTIRDMDGFIDSMKKEGVRTGIQALANMSFGESFRASRDPIIVKKREAAIELLSHLSPVELDSAKQIFHRQEIRPEALKKIQVPVLIVAGDEDQPSNIGGYRKLSEMIPHVTYKTIHHAGYTVMLEQSQELINVLRDFIERAEQHQKVSIKSRENRTFGPK